MKGSKTLLNVDIVEYNCDGCKKKGTTKCDHNPNALDAEFCGVNKAACVCISCNTRIIYPANVAHPIHCSSCEKRAYARSVTSIKHKRLDSF